MNFKIKNRKGDRKKLFRIKMIEKHNRKRKITTEAIIVSVYITDQIKILRRIKEER